MQRVEHALFAGVAEGAVAMSCEAVPQDYVIALYFADLLFDVLVEIETDDASQFECFVRGEARGAERVSGQDAFFVFSCALRMMNSRRR